MARRAGGRRMNTIATDAPTEGLNIRYGYTLTDLDQLATYTVRAHSRWWPAGDRHDMYETAWHGITEHLYTTTEAPSRRDLLNAAHNAIQQQVNSDRAHYGRAYRGTSDRYAAY